MNASPGMDLATDLRFVLVPLLQLYRLADLALELLCIRFESASAA